MDYYSKYEKYYENLKGNENIVVDSKSLAEFILEKTNKVSNSFNDISSSNWNEFGKNVVVNQIFTNLNNDMTTLSNTINNDLTTACSIAINDLLPTVTEIKEKDIELKETNEKLKELESKEPNKKDENGEINPNYLEWENEVTKINNTISILTNTLEMLCTKADNYINQINSLGGESLINNSILGTTSEELLDYLLSLSDEELEEFLANYEGELILEVPLNLLELGLTSIDEMPTIRYDIKAIYDLLEDNEYKSLMINYLIGCAGGDVNIKSFYEKYPDLLTWNSTKYDPVYLFDYSMFAKKYRTNTELASALNIVLDHTIASTMLPYYQNGTLNTHKAVECSSIVLASDFLVHFSYGAPNDLTQEYMWREDTSSIVGIGGGNCHHFATGVLYRAMSLFSETPLANGTSRVKNSSSPFHELFVDCNKIPGASAFENSPNITTLNTSETLNSFTPGTIAAINSKSGAHVITYLGKGVDTSGNSVNIIADSNKTNGVSIRTMSDNELQHYKHQITESDISLLNNYSDTAINYEKYANKYGVNVN